jgi:NAD(P)-dependent dehydrogenase (short-subunit alcohol dehydrogenase family)
MQDRNIRPGLRVLITAGASGIGRAIADAFVEDDGRVHGIVQGPHMEGVIRARAEEVCGRFSKIATRSRSNAR